MKRWRAMAIAALVLTPAWSAGAQPAFQMYWNATNGFDLKQHPEKPDYANLAKLPAEFRKDVIVLYEHRFGIFDPAGPGPMLKPKKFKQHLQKIAVDIDREVPDRDFAGVIVLDYEAWAPGYAFGSAAIKAKWKTDYLKHNPAAAGAANLEKLLADEYDALARKYYESTIKLGKKLRPSAKWGLFAWPLDYQAPVYLAPDPNPYKVRNDEAYGWLWELLDVLTPSAYAIKHTLPDGTPIPDHNIYWTESTQRDNVRAIVREAKRLAKGKPVLLYLWAMEMPKPYADQVMSAGDVARVIQALKDEKADGLILWDHFSEQKHLDRTQKWLDSTFVPELVKQELCKPANNGGGGGGEGKKKPPPGMACFWLKGEKKTKGPKSEGGRHWLWVRPFEKD
jgi:Hyaluronidase